MTGNGRKGGRGRRLTSEDRGNKKVKNDGKDEKKESKKEDKKNSKELARLLPP